MFPFLPLPSRVKRFTKHLNSLLLPLPSYIPHSHTPPLLLLPPSSYTPRSHTPPSSYIPHSHTPPPPLLLLPSSYAPRSHTFYSPLSSPPPILIRTPLTHPPPAHTPTPPPLIRTPHTHLLLPLLIRTPRTHTPADVVEPCWYTYSACNAQHSVHGTLRSDRLFSRKSSVCRRHVAGQESLRNHRHLRGSPGEDHRTRNRGQREWAGLR